MAGSVAAALPPLLSKALSEGQSISPPLELVGATVLNECSTLAEGAMGSYRRKGASEKTAAANPPDGLRWGYASITKTIVGVVMQLLMANSSLPEIAWSDKLSKWLPDLAPGTAFENASLLDVASHTACLFPDGAKWTDAAWTQYTQAHYFNGTIAGREVWVKNIFQYGAVSNCTPELTTATNYVHVDGAVVLALIEERLSGLDFGALAKTLIFDPLNMSSAEVVDANPAGGLWATLSDLGIYGQWLVQGYNGRPEALAKTLLKQEDFVTLLSPITKNGVLQGYGHTFAVWKDWTTAEPRAGHGGCLGATLELLPTENLIHIVAFFPEDADWVLSCDTMSHTSTVLWSAASSIGQAFTACRQRPAHLCSATPAATSMSCEITERFTLDETTLDAPYKKSSCREEDLTEFVKPLLETYRAVAFSTKAFVVPEGCWGGIQTYQQDPCASIYEGFQYCAENNWDCGVFLVNNESYSAEDWPCRCGVSVPKAACSTSGEISCNISRPSQEINSSCLIQSGESSLSSSTSVSGVDPSAQSSLSSSTSEIRGDTSGESTSLPDGVSSASGEPRHCGPWLSLPFGLLGMQF